jgi:hypothetical protein
LLISLLILASAAYYVTTLFTGARTIENNSISYFVLVPAILKDLPHDSTDQVIGYYYRPAEGNEPATVSVKYQTERFAGKTYERLVDYFDDSGFVSADNVYMKDNIELVISHEATADQFEIISVTLLEH